MSLFGQNWSVSVRELHPLSMRSRYLPESTFKYGQTLPFTSMLSPRNMSSQAIGYESEPSGWKLRSWIASGIS